VEIGDKVHTLTKGIGYKKGQRLDYKSIDSLIGRRVTVQSRIARYRNDLMLMKDPIQNLTFCIPGAYAHYMKVPADMISAGAVLPLPDGVDDEQAALVEPAACALESIFATPHPTGVDEDGRHNYRGGIQAGGRVLIIGSGTLAMILAQLAKGEGAEEIWIIARSKSKVPLITGVLGEWPKIMIVPDYSMRPMEEKIEIETALEKELEELTDGELFDDIILACPSTDAQRFMFRLLNPNGYAVGNCFAGLQETSEQANIDLLHYRIGKMIGTSGCSTRTMETIIRRLETRQLSLKDFVCPHHYRLDDDPAEFFCTAADGRKPMLYPWE